MPKAVSNKYESIIWVLFLFRIIKFRMSDLINSSKIEEIISPIKNSAKDAFLSRKRSLRDSTSLDPNLKVSMSINFSRKHSNEPIKNINYKNGAKNKQFIVSELNRSIESIKIKSKNNVSEKVKNPFKIKNTKIELYCIQEEKEVNDKNFKEAYESFAGSTEDPTENKPKNSAKNKKKIFKNDFPQLNKLQLEASCDLKMKRTDGFMSFKPSIRGGNSSNSLFPSSSGETIISK